MVLEFSEGQLSLKQSLELPLQGLPTGLACDSHENLFVVGGCAGELPFAVGYLHSSAFEFGPEVSKPS